MKTLILISKIKKKIIKLILITIIMINSIEVIQK